MIIEISLKDIDIKCKIEFDLSFIIFFLKDTNYRRNN